MSSPSLILVVHYSEGDTTSFCTEWYGTLHSNSRIEVMEELWLRSLKNQGDSAVREEDFGTLGVAYILRGLVEQWEMTLWSMSIDLRDGCIGPDSSPILDTRLHVENTIKCAANIPQATSVRKLSVHSHILLLRGKLNRFAETFAGEAHIYNVTVGTSEFFSFVRSSIVWCMYMCKLGYEHDVFGIVLILHLMGLAHRIGDKETELTQRTRITETMKWTRDEMYNRLQVCK